ncbi:MAG: LysR family transcriptional regulator [Tissierellia bacterium]|nr:LysR family transcriptional regulator [Tissierellia bacterium]
MKLREYEYILTIACEQNLTRAAERLYVSQPALSRLLKNVEIEVGMPLFERRGKKMVLNGAGKIFVETAREIVDLDSRMKKKIHDMDIRNSELTICNPLLRSEFLVKNVLPVFCASYRDVPIISTIISQKKIQDVLQSGIAQLAFGIITPVYEQKLGYEKIAQEEMVLMVPVGHPLVEKAEVRDVYLSIEISPIF